MEPKFSEEKIKSFLPPEPTLEGKKEKERPIPKIVPADYRAVQKTIPEKPQAPLYPTSGPVPAPSAPAPQPTASAPSPSPADPDQLMAMLSKEVNELSKPLTGSQNSQTSESIGVKGEDGIIYPPEDDLGDPTDPPCVSGIFRSIMLLICFLAVIVAAWQVSLFLQPEFLRSKPFNLISEKSCDYLYCPPMRTPVVLSSHVEAQPSGKWLLKLQVQNQDMREQKLPNLQLTLEDAQGNKTQNIFEPSEYSTDPKVTGIAGGSTANILVPFEYSEGRPTAFRVQILEN